MTLRIGILGAGRIGRIHCKNVLSCVGKAQLVAICDPHLDKGLFANQSIPHLLTNEEEFWRLDLDAVIIASPTPSHFHQVKTAIELNRHILCEKPLDLQLEPHFAIERLLANSSVKLQIGFNRRFDKDFEKIASLSHYGTLGQPYYLRITSRDPGLPSFDYLKTSGGMLLDMSIHDFDMARFVMNSEIVEVYACGAALVDHRLKEINDIDTAVVTLKFDNGAFGLIDNSRQAVYGYDQRIELFGSLGSLSNQNHRPSSVQMHVKEGTKQEPILNFFLQRYQYSYLSELNAFIDSCVNNKPCKPDINDAIQAVKLALIAKRSLATNQPIKVAQ